ncbi:hypothetical protein ACOSQ3_000086 [Xanthoceras sorbifolium]
MKRSFFINVFLVFSLLCVCFVSPNLIEDSCLKAAKSDPNLRYDFCIACLEANPKSQNASLEDLVVFSIELTISNATDITSYITELLREKRFDQRTKNGLQDCYEIYSDANSTLQDAINDFGSNDYEKASLEVSSAMDAPTTCEDGFKEKKKGGEYLSPLNEKNNIFFELAVIPLAFISMFH